jgi:hypothetical protein
MRAITRPADDAVSALDLNDIARDDGFLFVRNGTGIAGRGVAARIAVEAGPAFLASIEHVDESGGACIGPGAGPLGIGWVPFTPGAPGELVVPAVVVGKGPDGRHWVTTIDGADQELPPPCPP